MEGEKTESDEFICDCLICKNCYNTEAGKVFLDPSRTRLKCNCCGSFLDFKMYGKKDAEFLSNKKINWKYYESLWRNEESMIVHQKKEPPIITEEGRVFSDMVSVSRIALRIPSFVMAEVERKSKQKIVLESN